MSEMVERVARAMEPGAFAVLDGKYTCQNRLTERRFLNAEKTAGRARKKARVALEAMREPTRAMGWAAAEKDMMLTTPKIVWQSMLDAALKEI